MSIDSRQFRCYAGAVVFFSRKGNNVATRRGEGKRDCDMLRATWDLLGDVCISAGVRVAISLLPTERRGVFLVEAKAVQTPPNEKPRVLARYRREFPNSQAQDLSAALFQATNHLDRLVAETLGGPLDTAYAPTK